jgi:acetoin utilization deacetylase AcuC-like enzyme
LLTEKAYRYLTEMLIEFRDALRPYPILLALEGGFDHSAAGACVREILDTLTFSGRRGRIPVMTTPKGIQAYQALLPVHTPLQVWAD